MDFNEYQKRAGDTDLYLPTDEITNEERADLIEYRTLCLCGEVGELANKVKKIRRDKENELTDEMRAYIIHELGDILWYMATLCTIINTDMNEVAQLNIKMLADRKKNNKIKGSGDNR